MKRPIFIMLVLVAIAFAGPMLMKKPDGTPFLASPLDIFSADSTDTSSPSNVNSSQSFYKWQSEDGTWHYSDQPQEGQNIETVTVNTNTNLIQGLRIEKETEETKPSKKVEAKQKTDSFPLPMTVPLDKVSEMLEDANNLQQVMDDRKKAIDRTIRNR
jgi:hypothetical protein